MAYRKNQTNAQIVPLALRGIEGETTTGNMSTEDRSRAGYAGPTGAMPRVLADLYRRRNTARKVSTVIYSYNTPIAWLDADYGWIVPDETYSVTTTAKHQSQFYAGWNRPGLGSYRRIAMPYDATDDDADRVLSGELVFTSKGYGASRTFTGTVPGPNFVSEV